MDVDLTALGLPPLAGRVLACLAADTWTTSVEVAGQLGASRPQVADAVQHLVQLGLAERTRGRRPAPVRLAEGVVAAVEARLAELADEREDQARRATDAAAHLRRAAALAPQRPAPSHYLDPAGPVPGWRLHRPTTRFEAVCRPDCATVLYGQVFASPARVSWPRRVLVVGEPPPHRAAWMVDRGVEVRTAVAVLPVLLLVDSARAQVEVSAGGRSARTAWTHDAAQVAALSRLFALWWAEAQPWQEPGPRR